MLKLVVKKESVSLPRGLNNGGPFHEPRSVFMKHSNVGKISTPKSMGVKDFARRYEVAFSLFMNDGGLLNDAGV